MIQKSTEQQEEYSSQFGQHGTDSRVPKVMQESSVSCIAAAITDNDNIKYARYIAEYLGKAGLSIGLIVQAQMIEPYCLEVKDESGTTYVVCMNERYGLIGIRKNSLNGPWVFTVNY